MAKYAANTEVSVERSKAQIEATLTRYGADQFMAGWDPDRAFIGFRCHGRHVKFVLPLPRRDAEEFRYSRVNQYAARNLRSADAQLKAWEQACRQRWRALALCIKAKLETVESGITTFEDEFLAHIVLPNGETAGQWMHPQIESAYETGTMPSLLPALPPARGEA